MEELRRILLLLDSDPLGAADKFDELAERLHQRARDIRLAMALQRDPDGYTVPGGMADRVKMNVVGPDGQVKQSIDTQRN